MNDVQEKRMMSDEVRDFMLDLTRDVLTNTVGEKRVQELESVIEQLEIFAVNLNKEKGENIYFFGKIGQIVKRYM